MLRTLAIMLGAGASLFALTASAQGTPPPPVSSPSARPRPHIVRDYNDLPSAPANPYPAGEAIDATGAMTLPAVHIARDFDGDAELPASASPANPYTPREHAAPGETPLPAVAIIPSEGAAPPRPAPRRRQAIAMIVREYDATSSSVPLVVRPPLLIRDYDGVSGIASHTHSTAPTIAREYEAPTPAVETVLPAVRVRPGGARRVRTPRR